MNHTTNAPRARWLVAVVLALASAGMARAQDAQTLRLRAFQRITGSLRTVPLLEPGPDYVADAFAMQRLGKALFWDQQLGSDGQACASCHFHAGADSRSKNQLNPGFRNTVPGGDMTFGNSPLQPASLPPFGPNYQLTQADFPLHRLADPTNAGSALLSDTNDVVSSQGSFTASFGAIGIPYDVGQPSVNTAFGPFYNVNGQLVRTTAPRNTPSVVNAIFNYRN